MKLQNTSSVPVKIPSIDSNDNPAVQEALIILLKLSHVLILAFGHVSPSISKPSLKILLPRNTRHFVLSNQAIKTRFGSSLSNMADEPNTEENNEPKRDDFYGFALYTFKARRYSPKQVIHSLYPLLIVCNFRPNSAEVDRNKNGEDDEDGGVTSKAVAAEGSVADFLRKEATSNNDFR